MYDAWSKILRESLTITGALLLPKRLVEMHLACSGYRMNTMPSLMT